jgi:hypothetical protein
MAGPTQATIKRLFAVSGNRCAFPGCKTPLVHSASGKVTGRICHIKARKPGWARYDPDQTDEERHAFENLILMCPVHHDVIDSDEETYTVEKLQEIKARHETENAYGYEPSDAIVNQLLAYIDDVAIVISASDHAQVDWGGDVLQPGSTKTVIERVFPLEGPGMTETIETEGLIKDIQSDLYSDNSRLPYVLTLCLDLCDRTGLTNEYGKWLRKELNGYRDYQRFRSEFDNEDQFTAWMERWAAHRMVEPYVKAATPSSGWGGYEIVNLPIRESFIPFSVAELARMVRGGSDGNQEFSMPLLSLSRDYFAQLKDILAERHPGTELPSDTRVFYNVSQLEQILDRVRNIVLSLLSDVRQRIAGS